MASAAGAVAKLAAADAGDADAEEIAALRQRVGDVYESVAASRGAIYADLDAQGVPSSTEERYPEHIF